MMRLATVILGLSIAVPASAQNLSFDFYDVDGVEGPDWLLDFDDVSTWSRTGTGAPTVAWDADINRYVMYFESRFSESYIDSIGATDDFEGCRNNPTKDRVVWGLGRATSPDGVTWTADANPVLEPVEGTFYHCQAAQPTVVIDEGGTYHLFFKAQQVWEKFLLGDGTDRWGASRFTGVGYATSTDGVNFTVPSEDPVVPISQDFGFPSIIRVQLEGETDPTWYMYVAENPEIFLLTSPSPDKDWVYYDGGTKSPVLQPGAATWTDDLVFNPSAVCEPPEETFPFTLFFGGRDLDPTSGAILTAGWGRASSIDSSEFFISADSPYFSWAGAESWRHWEAMRVDQDYVLWFSERDADSLLRISFVYSMDEPTWASSDVNNRLCEFVEPDTDTDTDSDTDADTDSDTDSDSDSDTSGPGVRRGCLGCNGGSEGLAGAFFLPLGLLGMALVRRRRS